MERDFDRLFVTRAKRPVIGSEWIRGAGKFSVLALFLTLAGNAFADNSKISPDLQPLLSNPAAQVNVIVQYNSSLQNCSGGGLLGGLLCPVIDLLGGTVNAVFTLVNAVAGTVTAGNVAALSDQPNVSYISPDRSLSASASRLTT